MAVNRDDGNKPVSYGGKIRKLIMAGTPNYGSAIADLCPNFLNVQCEEMEFGSKFIWDLHENWRSTVLPEQRILPEHLLVIAGTRGDGILEGDDDTVVNVASVALPMEFLSSDHLRYVPYRHLGDLVAIPQGGTHVTLLQVRDFLRDGSTPKFYWPSSWILDDGLFLVRLVDGITQQPIAPPGFDPIDFDDLIFDGHNETNEKAGTITTLNLPQNGQGYDFTVHPSSGSGYSEGSGNTGPIIGGRPTVHWPIKLDANLPDLTGTWSSLIQSCKGAGETQKCQLKGTVEVHNQGNQKASKTYLRFYLSADNGFDGGDTFLRQVVVSALKPGKEKSKKMKKHKLPTGQNASGKYVIAVIDATGLITESDETNNAPVFGSIP
jgi:hypothetical protein